MYVHLDYRDHEPGQPDFETLVQSPGPATPKPTRVVHVSRDTFDLYIGRQMGGRLAKVFIPTGWGNPFKSPAVDHPIARYRAWFLRHPELPGRISELRGKVLGCWCAPKGGLDANILGIICHGEVLAAMADFGVPQPDPEPCPQCSARVYGLEQRGLYCMWCVRCGWTEHASRDDYQER